MNYLLDLFTPETWRAFQEKGESVTGFRPRHNRLAIDRVRRGDIFICYLTRLSRWCGVLRVESELYHDDAPIFDDPDPFTVRFRVRAVVALKPESAIPIRDDKVWRTLTITKQHDPRRSHWTGFFRGSLNRFSDSDGRYLVQLLERQKSDPENYPLTDKDKRHLSRKTKVRTPAGEVEVEVPDDEVDDDAVNSPTTDTAPATTGLPSIQMQAKVAQIGIEMGFRVWVPRNDKVRVRGAYSSRYAGRFPGYPSSQLRRDDAKNY